jgi:hypothetical protein
MAATAEPPAESPPDRPLPAWLAVLGVVLFMAVAVLSAVIEVVLVPVRAGSTIVPVSVALAVLGNICVPVLARRAVPTTIAAALPAVAWVATVLFLSQARPEGDVLLVGTSPLVYVTYALLGVGIVTLMVTVVRGQGRADGRRPAGR